MIGDALGVAPEDRADLLRWSDDMLRGLAPTSPARSWPGSDRVRGLHGVRQPRSSPHAATSPRDDLMSVLVHAEVDGDRLDHDSLVHESLLILIGGDETTRHVISGGVYQLLPHRDQWDRLRADRGADPDGGRGDAALGVADQEHGPHRHPRRRVLRASRSTRADRSCCCSTRRPTATRTCSTTPFTLRHRPRRRTSTSRSASAPTSASGNSLARLELTVMFEQLLDRLPDLELADSREPAYRPANFVSGYESMPVQFSPTRPVGR